MRNSEGKYVCVHNRHQLVLIHVKGYLDHREQYNMNSYCNSILSKDVEARITQWHDIVITAKRINTWCNIRNHSTWPIDLIIYREETSMFWILYLSSITGNLTQNVFCHWNDRVRLSVVLNCAKNHWIELDLWINTTTCSRIGFGIIFADANIYIYI